MSISRQNLTVIIVTFRSENVIHNCIQSIDSDIKVLVVDNSNSKEFKENIENKYKNVSCILSEKNSGMGAGNNLGIKNIKTDFAFILNPDVILEPNSINYLIEESQKLETFGIISPIEINKDYPNYKLIDNSKENIDLKGPLKVIASDPDDPNARSPGLVNRALHEEFGHPYEAIPGATHMVQIEKPKAAAKIVTEFFKEIGFGS